MYPISVSLHQLLACYCIMNARDCSYRWQWGSCHQNGIMHNCKGLLLAQMICWSSCWLNWFVGCLASLLYVSILQVVDYCKFVVFYI